MRNSGVSTSRKAGFRRLWLVISVIWVSATIAISSYDGGSIKVILLAGFLPPALLYALGSAIAWVVEGFAKADGDH